MKSWQGESGGADSQCKGPEAGMAHQVHHEQGWRKGQGLRDQQCWAVGVGEKGWKP